MKGNGMMIHQIEQKMVNRLRQVTSAIRQTGDKQVDIIKSRAEREASIEFAKAHAVWPCLVGEAMKEIGEDPEVVDTLFSVLETQGLLAGNGEIILPPEGGAASDTITALEAEEEGGAQPPPIR
jgi:hypothetical protein